MQALINLLQHIAMARNKLIILHITFRIAVMQPEHLSEFKAGKEATALKKILCVIPGRRIF